jgi:acetyltransferase-like isoleucine patch superfamily enzyme
MVMSKNPINKVRSLIRFLRQEVGEFEEAEALRAENPGVSFGSNVIIQPRQRFRAGERTRIEHGVYINLGGDWKDKGRFSCGVDCFIGAHSVIYAGGGVEFGDNVELAPHTLISSHRYPFRSAVENHMEETIFAPVRLGNNVMLNMGSCILPGVSIGDNSVVAARAVVTKDVPENSVVMGVPARIVRRLD